MRSARKSRKHISLIMSSISPLLNSGIKACRALFHHHIRPKNSAFSQPSSHARSKLKSLKRNIKRRRVKTESYEQRLSHYRSHPIYKVHRTRAVAWFYIYMRAAKGAITSRRAKLPPRADIMSRCDPVTRVHKSPGIMSSRVATFPPLGLSNAGTLARALLERGREGHTKHCYGRLCWRACMLDMDAVCA